MKLRDYFEGWLSPEDLRDAANRQVIYGGSFDTALLELEVLTPTELMAALRAARGLESAPPQLLRPGLERPWDEMPDAWLLARDAVPLAVIDGQLWIAIHPDLHDERLEALRAALPDAVLTVTAAACVRMIADERRGHAGARDQVLVAALIEALRAAETEAARPRPARAAAASIVDPGDSDVTITIVDDGPEEAQAVRPGFTAAIIPALTRGEAIADSAEFDVAVDEAEPEVPREEAAPAVIPRLKRIDSSLYVAAEPQEPADAPALAAPVIPSLTRSEAAPVAAQAPSEEAVPEDRDEGAREGAATPEPTRASAPAGASEGASAPPSPATDGPPPALGAAQAAPAPELLVPVIPTLKRSAAQQESVTHAATHHAAVAAGAPSTAPAAAAPASATPHAAAAPASATPHAAAAPASATPHAAAASTPPPAAPALAPTTAAAAPAPTPDPPDAPAPPPATSATTAPQAAEADAPLPRARPERSGGYVPMTLLQARPPSDRHEAAASLDTQLHAALTTGGRREAMIERLRQLGEPAYAKIAEIFPGPLDLPRGDLKNLPQPSAHGPLLRLCIILGEAIVPSLLPRLRDPNPNTRFYAALVFQELRSPSCVGPLAELAFDEDRDVRTIAMRVLETYHGAPGHARAVQRIRGELGTLDPQRRKQAIQAMGTLRDVLAIPRLIDTLDEDELEIRAAALTSLCAITGQHLGMAPAPWRAWYAAHGRRSRGEWMIESLSHGDAAVRRWAAEELVRTTGQRIPFDPRGSEEERAEAIARWRAWIAEHPSPSASTPAS